MQLRPATDRDLPGIERLLSAAKLPVVGLSRLVPGFVIAEEGPAIVGAAAVEPCGEGLGLLRSVVVSADRRQQGLGRRLVERVIQDARGRGLEALYLLTTTAESYFPLFGFAPITRDRVPESVRATEEFREACPESATVMTVRLASQAQED
jgi:amino-acid N-acetyltransferase